VPLRIRLVLVLVLLVALGLAAIEAITYDTIQSSLVSTVDSQMKSSVSVWEQYFQTCADGFCNTQLPAFAGVQPDTFAAAYDPNGKHATFPTPPGGSGNPVERCTSCSPGQSVFPHPILSSRYIRQVLTSSTTNQWRDAGGTDGVHTYRVLSTVFQLSSRFGSFTYVLVVAFPLTGVNSTMRHILTLELVIGACILVALAAASWFFVRLGLRPLEEMARTASEIAAGDLTKRVEDTDERTEVGQLGTSLNVMLAQIERAFREREASEERLRRFVGDASHELRTPLTSIRGYAELFKSGLADRPEDLAAALGRIESESSRMGGLVDDLLLLARLDQGRPLGHDPVDLTQLAADAVQDANIVQESRSIRMISTGPCLVIGDEQRLRQVLGNLITNAVAYSPPGSPIEVAVHMDRAPAAESVPAGLTGLPGLPALSGRASRSGRSARLHGGGAPRPLGPDARRPFGSDAVQPFGSDAVRPSGSDATRPSGSDATRPSGSDAVRPSGSDAVRPSGSDTPRPSGSDTPPSGSDTRAFGSDATRPLGPDATRPLGPDATRPLGAEDLVVPPARPPGSEAQAILGADGSGSGRIDISGPSLGSGSLGVNGAGAGAGAGAGTGTGGGGGDAGTGDDAGTGTGAGTGAGTGPGSGSTRAAQWPGTRASVAVIDHGPGIPAESRPYVFERFWRADPSRGRASGGTGLGLAIVAAVVAAHGGQVTIRDTPGGGATFVVDLPAAPEMSHGSGPDAGPG
jgi:two-component system, OmpR family, sensor kinase